MEHGPFLPRARGYPPIYLAAKRHDENTEKVIKFLERVYGAQNAT